MIEAGLNRIVEQLEEIGSSAGKEFALETAMEKMKQEWSSVCFECVPYRESGMACSTRLMFHVLIYNVVCLFIIN